MRLHLYTHSICLTNEIVMSESNAFKKKKLFSPTAVTNIDITECLNIHFKAIVFKFLSSSSSLNWRGQVVEKPDALS